MDNSLTPTYFEARKWASLFISSINEVDDFDIDYLLTKRQKISTTELLLRNTQRMDQNDWEQFKQDILQLAAGVPTQYIVNVADFYNNAYYVDENVLIPRNETEELIEFIFDEFPQNEPIKVLDIGTGSGAIAITLKKYRSNWQVTASDISNDALKIAKKNAQSNEVNIDFVLSDLFEKINEKFNLIISNPPYISIKEKDLMDKKVLEYEPDLALFADDNGLAVYQKIAQNLSEHLKENGSLFLEIGFQQGKSVAKILRAQFPSSEIVVKPDITGNDRMIYLKR